MVGEWFAVLTGHPVMGLLHGFAPLGRRVAVRFGGRLPLMALHDHGVKPDHHFFLDIGDTTFHAA
jgi:hypothetical protein